MLRLRLRLRLRLPEASASAVVVGGVTGAVTSVDAHALLLAPFVSLPLPVPVAQLTYVPVWVTRAENPITRSTPGRACRASS